MNLRRRQVFAIAAVMLLFCVAPKSALSQEPAAPESDANKALASKPTPRLADGHPDLSGLWGAGGGRDAFVVNHGDHVEIRVAEHAQPHKVAIAKRKVAPNQPPYKPELLAKVESLNQDENKYDPIVHCKPAGFVRQGPPVEIMQIPGRVVFFYEQENENFYRIIPTDGRKHDPDADPSYNGDAVAHWDGDTLVVDTVSFNDDTWLGIDGWFHSTSMHVVERVSREGDLLHYQATVDDPQVFTRPWVMNARTFKPTTQEILENAPCADAEDDLQHLVNHDHF